MSGVQCEVIQCHIEGQLLFTRHLPQSHVTARASAHSKWHWWLLSMQKINQYSSVCIVKHSPQNFQSQEHCSGLLLLWRYNTMPFSDWSHCFRAKTVELVHITSYNMQQYIKALSITSSTNICAALCLSGCKHEKQSTTNFLVSKNQHFLLQSSVYSVYFQAVLQFPNHHSSALHFLLVAFLAVSSRYSFKMEWNKVYTLWNTTVLYFSNLHNGD